MPEVSSKGISKVSEDDSQTEETTNVRTDPAQNHDSQHHMHNKSTYKILERIGSGGSGVVFRASGSSNHADLIDGEVAIKCVRARGISRRVQMYLTRELFVQRTLRKHPYICNLYHHFSDRENVYLVMEMLRGGDLFSALKNTKQGFTERMSLTVIVQVLDALKHMHDLGIAHRDIKLENIMFTTVPDMENLDSVHIKVIDFGLSCVRNVNASQENRTSSEKCGTIRYSAPEIDSQTEYIPELTDIWSSGVVLYSILARRNPFKGTTEREVLNEIQSCELDFSSGQWPRISIETVLLIRKMLSIRPENRPSASTALEEAKKILQKLNMIEVFPVLLQPEPAPFSEDDFLARSRNNTNFTSSVSQMIELKDNNFSSGDKGEQKDSVFHRLRNMILKVANIGVASDGNSSNDTDAISSPSDEVKPDALPRIKARSSPIV